MERIEICPSCQGRRVYELISTTTTERSYHKCPHCNGKGAITIWTEHKPKPTKAKEAGL